MMTRSLLGIAAVLGSVLVGSQTASAQIYSYGAPAQVIYVPGSVYPGQVIVESSPVVTSAYYAPAYVAPAPVVQMNYSVPVAIPVRSYLAPAVVIPPTTVRQSTRVSPHNYTQTTRVYGPTPGPHYSRIHVHSGLFGTRVRERVR
jgi:hypothetical protein